MSKFDLYKTLNLGFLGEGWEKCEIKFTSLTVGESRELAKLQTEGKGDEEILQQGLDFLKNKFVEGTGLSGGEVVELEQDDLEELPIVVVNRAMRLLSDFADEGSEKKS